MRMLHHHTDRIITDCSNWGSLHQMEVRMVSQTACYLWDAPYVASKTKEKKIAKHVFMQIVKVKFTPWNTEKQTHFIVKSGVFRTGALVCLKNFHHDKLVKTITWKFKTSGFNFQRLITLDGFQTSSVNMLNLPSPNEKLLFKLLMLSAFLQENPICLQEVSRRNPKGYNVMPRRGITTANDR